MGKDTEIQWEETGNPSVGCTPIDEAARPTIRRRRKNQNYKRITATNGYIQYWVGKDHHLSDSKGYAYEHRIVAEIKLGRRLQSGEVVHHIDHDKTNNDPENLEVYEGHHEHNVQHRKNQDGRRLPGEMNPKVSCECGCGELFEKFDEFGRPRKYVSGHNSSLSPARDSIVSLVENLGRPIRASDVAEHTGQSVAVASTNLLRMAKQGYIKRISRGLYGNGGI